MNSVRGLTFIELLISLLIISVLIVTSIPSFQNLLKKHKSQRVFSLTLQAIYYARAKALTTQTVVTLCPTTDELSKCGTKWEDGIQIFADIDENGKFDHKQDTLLRSFPSGNHAYLLRWASFGNRSYLQYTPLGHTKNQNGTFIYCPQDGDVKYANAIIINRAGRARRGYDKNNNGIIERANGKDIAC